jgi:hypothetical protein
MTVNEGALQMSAEVQKESDLYTKKYFFIVIFGCEGLGPIRKGGGGLPLHSMGWLL